MSILLLQEGTAVSVVEVTRGSGYGVNVTRELWVGSCLFTAWEDDGPTTLTPFMSVFPVGTEGP